MGRGGGGERTRTRDPGVTGPCSESMFMQVARELASKL
jgi:hypothetical protein